MHHHVRQAVPQLLQLLQGVVVVPQVIPELLLLQARPDPRAEQHRVERLGQVVRRSPLNAADHAVHLIQAGDDDDRDRPQLRIRLHPLQHRVAVHLRHHHVQQHQVERRLGHALQRLHAVLRLRDGVPKLRDVLRQHVAVDAVVFNH